MTNNVLFFILSWGPVVLWAGLIFFLSSIPSLNSGLGLWDFVLRKMAHMFEFAVLTGLLIRAIKRTWKIDALWLLSLWGGSLSLLYAMSDEFHQRYVPGRVCSLHDVTIDFCGISFFLVGYYRWSRTQNK